jgi:hypothetical protein
MPRSLEGSDRALAPGALPRVGWAAEVAGSAPTAKWVELGTAYARSLPTKG